MDGSKKKENTVLIFGTSQIAVKTREKLREKKYTVHRISSDSFEKIEANISETSKFESIKKLLHNYDISNVKAVCILDEKDSRNIELTLAILSITREVPIYVSLINESLSKYFSKNHKNLHVFDPVSISAPVFLDAFEKTKGSEAKSQKKAELTIKRPNPKIDKIILSLFVIISSLFIGSIIFFHIREGLSWIDSLYFTATTMATVGYGDINLKNSGDGTKIFAVFIILTFYALMWVTFSFVIDFLNKRRYEAELGRRRYFLKNHIIICGIGKVSQIIAETLMDQKKKVLGIELNRDNRYLGILKSDGAHVFIGDSTMPENLIDAGIENASCIFVMINDDLKSLEVGLNAISLNPNIPIIIRIQDEDLTQNIRSELKIPHVFSTTAIAADYLINKIESLN